MEESNCSCPEPAKAERHSIRAMMRLTPSAERIFSTRPGIYSSSFELTRMPRLAFSSRLRICLVSGRWRKASPQKFSEKWMTVEWTGRFSSVVK